MEGEGIQKNLSDSVSNAHPLSKFEDSIKKLRRRQQEFNVRPPKQQKFMASPPQGMIREFRINTESEISNISKEQYFKNLKQGKIKKRESRVDSFFSKRSKPIDLLLGIPKNINLDKLDHSSVKTPKK